MTSARTTTDESVPEARGGMDWKFAVMGALSAPKSRRIFTAAEFHQLVKERRPGASSSTARTMSEMLVNAGALRRVTSGVFLNQRVSPPAEMTEVAAHIRSGAVISLHSVLGVSGFLNNLSAIVTAVVPTSATKRPSLGTVKPSNGGVFRFYGLAERFFPVTEEDRTDMLAPGHPCETFRPEAALLHWLHLSSMQRSSMTDLPKDVDMEVLDQELLSKLAARWELGRALNDWRARAEAVDFGAEPDPSTKVGAVTQDALDRGNAARERMMARRKLAP